MNNIALIINIFALISFGFAFSKDKEKSIKSLKTALKVLIKIMPMILIIVIIIGLVLGFVPPDQLAKFFGEQAGFIGVLIIGAIGSILHIPSLISFPLAASLLESGASIMAAAAFITTLTMVGTIYIPMEARILGKKIALLRNGLSFIVAIIIAVLMGLIL